MAVFITSILLIEIRVVGFFEFINNFEKVLTILILKHWLGQFTHALFGYPSLTICDSFEASNLEALTLFEDFDIGGSL